MADVARLAVAVATCGLVLGLRGEERAELEITDFHVRTSVTSRYAVTETRSVVHNPDTLPREAIFDVDIPSTAFISNFTLTVNGKIYPATVQTKDKAREKYNTARRHGQTTGHVGTRGRDLGRFRVSVTVRAGAMAEFALTHEELLRRRGGLYEVRASLRPGRPVRNLTLEVAIAERGGVERLRVRPLRTSDLLTSQDDGTGQAPAGTTVERTPTCARVTFAPTPDLQATFGPRGVKGDFVVVYDVKMDEVIGDVQTGGGHFVHYFAPRGLPVVPKNIVFVIDVSSSMFGTKLAQTQDAMKTILDDLRPDDFFNLITFSDVVEVWKPNGSVQANARHLQSARAYVDNMEATGWTDIDGALRAASETVKKGVGPELPPPLPLPLPPPLPLLLPPPPLLLPLVVFLTDGEPTSGETDGVKVARNAARSLSGTAAALYCLAFGDDADSRLLLRLALDNSGTFRRVYEDEDAGLQLRGFYREISTPLLSGVRLGYPGRPPTTAARFPAYFEGSEIVVAGPLAGGPSDHLLVRLEAGGARGSLEVEARLALNGTGPPPACPGARGPFEAYPARLWAFLAVKELLYALAREDGGEGRRLLARQAEALSLRHSFVTPLTSMVVERPEEEEEEAETRPPTLDLSTPTPVSTATDDRPTTNSAILATSRPEQRETEKMLRSGGILVKSVMEPTDIEESEADYFYEDSYEDTDNSVTNFRVSSNIQSPGYEYSVDGDPHFVVKIPDTTETLCFTIDGREGDILSLIEDPVTGVWVKGHLRGAPTGPGQGGHARNFFDWIAVGVTGGFSVNASLDGLVVEGERRTQAPWSPPIAIRTTGLDVEVSRHRAANVRVGEGLEFLLLHHRSPLRGGHLGFYVVRGDGLSPQAQGLLGQFRGSNLRLEGLKISDGRRGGRFARLVQRGRSARVHSVSKMLKDSSLPEHLVSCWALARKDVHTVLNLPHAGLVLPSSPGAQ